MTPYTDQDDDVPFDIPRRQRGHPGQGELRQCRRCGVTKVFVGAELAGDVCVKCLEEPRELGGG